MFSATTADPPSVGPRAVTWPVRIFKGRGPGAPRARRPPPVSCPGSGLWFRTSLLWLDRSPPRARRTGAL